LSKEAKEKKVMQQEAVKRSSKEWEEKRKSIAEKILHRTLLMEQAKGTRSSEVIRLEQLQRAYQAIKELDE
jgi:hypothetical protein